MVSLYRSGFYCIMLKMKGILTKNNKAKKLAKNLKAVIFDADGVVFSGQVFMGVGPDGVYKEMLKTRSHIDGQGISLLRSTGLRVAIVTAESSFAQVLVDKLNNLPSAKSGAWVPIDIFTKQIGTEKTTVIGDWLAKNNISWSECAYMGDDVGDFSVMQKVGLPSAPVQAEDLVKDIALFVAERRGGDGAVRDLCNFILDAKGVDQKTLALW